MPPDAPPVVEAPPPVAAPEAPVAPPAGFEDAFGALEAMGREDGTPAPPETPPPGDGRVRGPDGKFIPKDKAPEKPAANGKPPEAPPLDDIDPSKLKTSELAKHYHALKAKEKEWIKKQAEYETKLKTPPEWPEKKTYEEKLAEQEKRVEEYNKKVAQYETELQFTNFAKSQYYKDNFEKPYTEAWVAGQKRAESLKIVERKNEETGEVLQQGRKATAADFDAIMSIFDDDVAAERAEQLFGPTKAAYIIHHREQVMDKQFKANAAIKEYQEKGQVWEKDRREQMEKQSKEFEGRISFFKQEHTKKYAHMFTPDESDPREKELISKGQEWVSKMLKGGQAPEERAIGISAMQLKAEHGDLWMYRANKFSKRVKELEAELAKFKSSVPANGDGKGREAPAAEETPEQKLWKMGKER
jgi:hypothetical protein